MRTANLSRYTKSVMRTAKLSATTSNSLHASTVPFTRVGTSLLIDALVSITLCGASWIRSRTVKPASGNSTVISQLSSSNCVHNRSLFAVSASAVAGACSSISTLNQKFGEIDLFNAQLRSPFLQRLQQIAFQPALAFRREQLVGMARAQYSDDRVP